MVNEEKKNRYFNEKIKMIKSPVCFLVPIVLGLITVFNPMQAQTNKKPNIIIIMADDLGYNDISCFGNTNIKTPHLDQMALEGIKFTDFHSNGAVCSPTRAALITGKYQQRTGITGVVTAKSHRHVGLPLSEITFAEALKSNGYVTGMFGKWHVGYRPEYNPTKQGFDEYKGFVSGNVDYHSHIDQEGHFDWWEGDKQKDDEGYSTDLITNYSIDFIKRHKDSPFLLYLPHEAPHYPFQGRSSDAFRKEGDVRGHSSSEYSTIMKDTDSVLALRKEMIEVMDESIGKVIATLKQYNIEDNTLVLFFSDNGASTYGSNKPLRGGKGSLYEGGHRVPAIAWWPTKINGGTITNESLMTMDVYPTLLDITGIKNIEQHLDGISFKKLLLNNKGLKKRDLYWQYHGVTVIRSGQYKLIEKSSKSKINYELFDLLMDVEENTDISSEYPGLIKKMSKKLKKWKQAMAKEPSLLKVSK